MHTLIQDLQYAFRMLFKNPAVTCVAVLTLAVGIGANSAIFSVVDVLVFRPSPFERLDRIMTLSMVQDGHPDEQEAISPSDFQDWQEQNTVFEKMAAFTVSNVNITGIGDPEYVAGAAVSEHFFDILGVEAEHGRLFLPGENEPGNDRVAVISHELWQQRYSEDPGFIGNSLSLNGKNTVVVGILPADYRYPIDQDLWTPLAMTTDQMADRSSRTIGALALLSDTSSKEEAQTVMTTIVSRIAQTYPDTHKGWNVYIQSLREQMGDEITEAFSYTLFGAVIFVLLLACANVMNLQLARATGRHKEIAIRTALGANQWRVIRQLLIESLVLSAIAGSLGILVAYWGIDMIKPTLPQELHKYVPMWSHMGIDGRVLAFTTSIAVLTGLVSGLAPAIQSARPNLNESLTDSSRGSSGGTKRSRMRSSLVVSEVAIALVLLVGASLMIQGFVSFLDKDLGFKRENLLTMRITLPETKYNEPHLITSFYQQAYERLSTVPGVRSVGGANYLHADNSWDMIPTEIEGRAALDPTEAPRINRHIVSPGYLTTLQVSLVRGRLIAESDNIESQPVAVISESMARRHWPDGNPIGHRIKVDGKPSVDGTVPIGGPWRTVVGVVQDATYFWFDDRANATVYLPALQVPRLWMNVVLRTAGDPLATVNAARSQIADLDPEQAVAEIKSMERIIANRLSGVRLGAILMGVFSVMALILAGVGIYSVMAYSVAQRTHEIGIRMAIGAGQKSVLTMILRQALILSGIGLAIGLPISYGLSSLVMSGIGPAMEFNSWTFVVFTVLLIFIAAAASAIPAIRATRIDPMIALRYE